MFELIYKSDRSLSGNPYPLWSWTREQKPWWHSLYINLKSLQFVYLAASHSLKNLAIWEFETSGKERWALWNLTSANQVKHKMKPPKWFCNLFSILHLKYFPQNWPIQMKMAAILRRNVTAVAQNVHWGLWVTFLYLGIFSLHSMFIHFPSITGQLITPAFDR
jgi:hypothetical protein